MAQITPDRQLLAAISIAESQMRSMKRYSRRMNHLVLFDPESGRPVSRCFEDDPPEIQLLIAMRNRLSEIRRMRDQESLDYGAFEAELRTKVFTNETILEERRRHTDALIRLHKQESQLERELAATIHNARKLSVSHHKVCTGMLAAAYSLAQADRHHKDKMRLAEIKAGGGDLKDAELERIANADATPEERAQGRLATAHVVAAKAEQAPAARVS